MSYCCNTMNNHCSSSPNITDPLTRLASTTGPVKNSHEAKTYLEHRLLIATDNNYTTETLANLLITTSFDPKIPNQVVCIMRVVVLLMLGNLHSSAVEGITTTVTEKIQTVSNQLSEQLERECEFLTAASSDQAKHTQLLHNIASLYRNSLLQLKNSTNIDKTASKLLSTSQTPLPTSDQIEPIALLTEIANIITKSVEELRLSLTSAHSSPLSPPVNSNPNTFANVVSNGSCVMFPLTTYNPDAPNMLHA